MDLQAIENALHAWVVGALGLPAAKVIWENQDGTAPPPVPFATLDFIGPYRAGGGQGELAQSQDLSAPAGQEISLTFREHMEWNLTVQVHGAPAGAQRAFGLSANAAMKMRLPTALDAVRSAGLAVVRVGDTQDLTRLFGAAHESRALLEVRLRTVDQATEKTGYIDRVGLDSPFTGPFDAP